MVLQGELGTVGLEVAELAVEVVVMAGAAIREVEPAEHQDHPGEPRGLVLAELEGLEGPVAIPAGERGSAAENVIIWALVGVMVPMEVMEPAGCQGTSLLHHPLRLHILYRPVPPNPEPEEGAAAKEGVEAAPAMVLALV